MDAANHATTKAATKQPRGPVLLTNETELVSKGYLTTFFLDIDILRNSLTGYRSIILRLNIDPKQDQSVEKMTERLGDEMKNALIQWSDSVRNSVERCQISYYALKDTIAGIKSDKLDASYEKIVSVFCPDIKDIADYTFEIHRCFIAGTLHELLNKMDNFYDQMTKDR